jgi:isoquinoline 1-oxidoreductase beta subunit
VLQAAADKANWTKVREHNTALGRALHECFGSICAQVVELRRNEAGAIHIERVTCAIDCGRPIHPDIIAQQVESAVIFGLTAALYGRITMKNGRVQQANFPDYPLLTLERSPLIDTIIMPSDEAPGGVGEVGTPPIAPALCNAIFRLTGKRIRDLPIADQVVMF